MVPRLLWQLRQKGFQWDHGTIVLELKSDRNSTAREVVARTTRDPKIENSEN